MALSDTLRKAKENKNDEFYTRLEDIEAEISSHEDYVRQFEGKTVLCNCDDPEWSNFYEFFRLHFKQLKLKKLITTHYNADGSPSYKLEWSGETLGYDTVNMIKTPLQGNGDFRSEECIKLLEEADIVVTNPPFSLFREYISLLVKYNKKFVIIGNNNAIAYKEVFPLLKENKVRLGYSSNQTCIFKVPNNYRYDEKITAKINDGNHYGKVPAISWFTNMDLDKAHKPLMLNKNYKGNEELYPKYYNYDAIDVESVKMIPKDYYGRMGVPITFLSEYCEEQFTIIGIGSDVEKKFIHKTLDKEQKEIGYVDNKGNVIWKTNYTVFERKIGNSLRIEKNGLPFNTPYNRIIIQRKHKEDGSLNE